jgi:hypothetical protein
MNVIDLLPNDSTIKAKERIIIDVRYYDEKDNCIPVSEIAARMSISIRNGIYLQETTEDFLDENAFGEGKKREIALYQNIVTDAETIYSVKLEENEFDKFNLILMQCLNTNVKNLFIKVDSESKNMKFSSDTFAYIFTHFKNISFDFYGYSGWAEFPDIDGSLESLSMESMQVQISKMVLSCSHGFNMMNCTFQSKIGDGSANLIISSSGKNTLYNTKIANKLFMSISGGSVKEFEKWKGAGITVSEFSIGFKDASRNEKRHNGQYDAILTISEMNDVMISGVSNVNDVPYYPLISVRDSNTVGMTNITKANIDLPTMSPVATLRNFMNFSLSKASYIGVGNTNENISFIRIYKTRIDCEISISSLTMHKLSLLNSSGVNCQRFSIADSAFSDSEILHNMKTSSINDLVLSNVSLKGPKINFKAISISIMSSSDIKTENEIVFEAKESILISDSSISSNKDLNINVGYESSSSVNNSSILSLRNINSTAKEDDADIENGSKITFNNSYISSRETVFDNINLVRFGDTSLRSSELSLKDIRHCMLGLLVNCRKLPMNMAFTNVDFRNSVLEINEPGSKQTMNFSSCKGGFNINCMDDATPNSAFKISLADSIVRLLLDAVSERKIIVNSKESLGSAVVGAGGAVSIVPDVTSIDRRYFERIKHLTDASTSKILYGSIAENS